MKRYLIAILIFFAAFGIPTATYKFLESSLDESINSLIHRLILLVLAIGSMIFFKVGRNQTNAFSKLTFYDLSILGLILTLFGLNNIFAKELETESIYKSILGLSFIKLTVNSIAEELMYRGFIQSYINDGQTKK